MLSDGRSGGLAMLWKEGFDVHFKSCSNTHIDVVVCKGNGAQLWQATRFYGHLDSSMRPISWNLLKSLKRQCHMPWIVFGILMRYSILMKSLDGWIEMLGRWKGLGSVCVTVSSLI